MSFPSLVRRTLRRAGQCNSEYEEDEQRDSERHQAEQLGEREAQEQAPLLAIGGCRIAQRAVQELAKHEADANGGDARTDGGETSADELCGSDVHNRTPLDQ